MAWLPFKVWWRRGENRKDFWRTYVNGVAISLGETPRYIFRQILQRLKEYHDQNVGYGNLLEGVLIGENKQVDLEAPNPEASNPDIPLAQRLAFIKNDFLDFEKLVTWVEELIRERQGVEPAYSSTKFHELCRLLDGDDYYRTGDELRRFGFFIRNNPLFYDDAAKYLFFKKVLTIQEYSETDFRNNVKLGDLQGWSEDVRNTDLLSVKDYGTKSSGNSTSKSGKRAKKKSQSGGNQRRTRGGANTLTFFCHIFSILQDFLRNLGLIYNPAATRGMCQKKPYEDPAESIRFFRNCLGHLREHYREARYHDAKILLALEDNLPMVIPVWFHDLVKRLDLDELTCKNMCGYSWMEFLSMHPTVFT